MIDFLADHAMRCYLGTVAAVSCIALAHWWV